MIASLKIDLALLFLCFSFISIPDAQAKLLAPTGLDFHHEVNRLRRQLMDLFHDFDRSFAISNDPFLAFGWNHNSPFMPMVTPVVGEHRERNEQGEQKAAATQQSDTHEHHPWGSLSHTGTGDHLLPLLNSVSIPRVDVVERDDHFVLKCDLPGVAREDVLVSVTPEGRLNITAEHSEKHEEKDDSAKYHRIERSYGKYHRLMQLPENVDGEAVQAKLENGVLQVTLPKRRKEELAPKPIKTVNIH